LETVIILSVLKDFMLHGYLSRRIRHKESSFLLPWAKLMLAGNWTIHRWHIFGLFMVIAWYSQAHSSLV